MSTFVTLKRFFELIGKNSTKIARNITVEPLLPLYIIANVLTAFAAQNLYLEKACRVNLNFGDEVCDALVRRETEMYKNEEIQVQKLVAKMNGWKTIVQTFIPCLLMLFVGSWSDRNKRRKPCMLIPVFGELISSAGLALNVYFKDLPMEYAGMTEALFEGITGGWATMLMGAFSYIADITTEKERTVRIGIANTCFSIGIPIAMSLSGILLKYIGFYGVFIVSVIIHLIAFLYGLFCMKESQEPRSDNPTKRSFIADFFDPSNAIETFKIFAKKELRLQVMILLIVVIVVVGPMHGEQAVLYLYTRLKFNWDHIDFSVYSTYSTMMTMGGTVIALGIFSYLVQMHDALVGIIGSVSKIAASFIYAFAVNSFAFYFGPAVEFFHYASFICMRSIASKMVEKEERGRLNSLIGVIEALAPSVYAPLYSRIYTQTIETFPGAFFLVGGGLKIIAVAIFLFMYISHLKKSTNSYSLPQQPEQYRRAAFDNPNFISDETSERMKQKVALGVADIANLHV